jgi:hypothetical protein
VKGREESFTADAVRRIIKEYEFKADALRKTAYPYSPLILTLSIQKRGACLSIQNRSLGLSIQGRDVKLEVK